MSVLALALGCLTAGTPSPPTQAAIARVAERGRASVVRIVAGGTGDAVVIGTHGELLTVGSASRSDVFTVLVGRKRRKAKVLHRDTETGAVLASMDGPGEGSPPAVASSPLEPGSWVVVVGFEGSELVPAVSRLDASPDGSGQLRVSPGVRAGSAVFNTRGQLIGIQLDRPGSHPRTIGIETVRARLSSDNPGPP